MNEKSLGGQEGVINFLTVISHQLKAPLHSIESLLKVIAEGFSGEISQQAQNLVSRALAKTEEARELLEDLLALERYSKTDLKKELINLNEILNEVFNHYHATAQAKNQIYSLKLPSNMELETEGDPQALQVALSNLIENAIKYTPVAGKIEVELLELAEDKRASISVADNGPGITQEEAANLFKPFFRSWRLKNTVSGTGLGLILTQKIIQAHGGIISFDSKPGVRTVFKISLAANPVKKRKENSRKIVIIGGVTSGPKAAARLRRLDEEAEITLIEKSDFLSYAGCGLPAYLSGKVSSPQALMSTSDATLRDVHFFEHIKNIRILRRTLALKIDRQTKTVLVRNISSGLEEKINYDILILATGAKSLIPEIEGLSEAEIISLYQFEDAERLKAFLLQKPTAEIYIIGGGLVGIETAESLISRGARVTVLEKDSQILKQFDFDFAQKIQDFLRLKGVKVLTNIQLVSVKKKAASYLLKTDKGEFSCDLIILSAGVKPNSELAAKAGLEIGKSGAILVNEHQQTSDLFIYAIGDCCETKNLLTGKNFSLPLGSVSTKMGRIVADNLASFPSAFQGSLGTILFKIFEIEVGRTGLNYKEAVAASYEVESVVVSGLDHSHYFEGAREVVFKALADKKTGQLLGVQGYGRGNVASRLGIAAVAITTGLTLDEVFKLDLGYYPAFNNPIDIIQTACLVLDNKLKGIIETISLNELMENDKKFVLIDLSPEADFSFQSIPGSVNLPLENLRVGRMPYEKNTPLILFSKTSSRAYEAFRYLKAKGWANLKVLEGGSLFYKRGF